MITDEICMATKVGGGDSLTTLLGMSVSGSYSGNTLIFAQAGCSAYANGPHLPLRATFSARNPREHDRFGHSAALRFAPFRASTGFRYAPV